MMRAPLSPDKPVPRQTSLLQRRRGFVDALQGFAGFNFSSKYAAISV